MKLKALALTAVAAIAMTTTASFAKPVGISTAGELEVKAGNVTFSRNQDNNNTVNPAFAKTSRPCSAASLAEIKDPLSRAASTTRTPRDKPDRIRFLRGKLPAKGLVPKGNSLTRAP